MRIYPSANRSRVRKLLGLWAFLSLGLLISASLFYIDALLPHPRHHLLEHMGEVEAYVREHNRGPLYTLYLVLDLLWMFTSLCLIGLLSLHMRFTSPGKTGHIANAAIGIFLFLAIPAFVFRVWENIAYLQHNAQNLGWLREVSAYMYLACLGIPAYAFIRYVLSRYIKAFLRFLRDAFLSLFFIAIVYLLISRMDQGGTILVALFYEPWNLFLLFVMLGFLAILISHFPVYAAIWWKAEEDQVRLVMAAKGRLFGFGTIYYDTSGRRPADFDNPVVQALRRSLGLLMYIAVFLIFFQTAFRYFEIPLDPTALSALLAGITFWVYYGERQRQGRWKRALRDPASQKNAVSEIVAYVRRFPWILLAAVLMAAAASGVAFWLEWHRISMGLFLFTLGLHMFAYILFNTCRSYFKYVFRSEALFRSNQNMYDPEVLRLFKKHDREGKDRGRPSFYRAFGKLSDNIRYLNLMRFVGLSALLCLILANAIFEVASFFNPLLVILLYIIVYYSLLVLLFKHLLYYHRYAGVGEKLRAFHRYILPLALLGILALGTYTIQKPNDLHRLREVPDPEPMTAHRFVAERFGDALGQDPKTYFVASYGGGLKANLWNLLLLRKLDSLSGRSFFGKTAVLSGVSGGAVGIANFTSLLHNLPDQQDWSAAIENIGRSNVLSNELTYLLGRDWMLEFIPRQLVFGRDRSYRSMEEHARLTGMESYNAVPLPQYWRNVYQDRKGGFPALIFNTTAVGGTQGVVPSILFPERSFPGAVDITSILHQKHRAALTFYGGASTTNRFPLFSPTAKIKGLGNFLDGGYFDNSGMLSALAAYRAIHGLLEVGARPGQPPPASIQPVFVSIINSRGYYTKHMLRSWYGEITVGPETSEFGSVVQTVTSIDKLPEYALSLVSRPPFVLRQLMMPYKIPYGEARELLRGDFNPFALMKRIKAHNGRIDSVLQAYKGYELGQWGVVEPPLARLLSKPAVRYQKAMVEKHPDIQRALSALLE